MKRNPPKAGFLACIKDLPCLVLTGFEIYAILEFNSVSTQIMSYYKLTRIVQGALPTAVLIGLLVSAIVFASSVFLMRPFVASTSYQLIQSGTEAKDYYTSFKSSEYLGRVLTEALASGSYIQAVTETGGIPEGYLPGDTKKALATWQKQVTVNTDRIDLGVLEIRVYGKTREEVAQVSTGVQKVLIEQNEKFRAGAKEDLNVRVFTDTLVEANPSVTRLVIMLTSVAFAVTVLYLLAVIAKRWIALQSHQYNLIDKR